jgi:hypothetical protein
VSLSLLSVVNWWSATFLEVGVLGLAWKRKLASQLPFFFGYLSLLVVNEVVMFCTYRIAGIHSKTYLYAYWIIQVLCISARAIVVYEVCQSILSPFSGIWRLVSRSLFGMVGILGIVILIAGHRASDHIMSAILTEERGLELVVASLLIVGLLFCRYYGVQVKRHLAWIALGLGFYSIVQVADNTFLAHWTDPGGATFAIWEALRHFSFNIALILWAVALWKPLPAVNKAPVLWSGNEYNTLSPLVTARLRDLNVRLLEIWK